MAKKKLKAVGCHIYAGGFSLGVREHFDVLMHLEEWKFGVATVEHNLKIPVHVSLPAEWPGFIANERLTGVDFVYGNPPCAPWSSAASKVGGSWRRDPRIQHWRDVHWLIKLLQPRVFACESVRGIYYRGSDFLEELAGASRKLGYATTHVLTNALEHGIPQARKRYFLVLHTVELNWLPTRIEKETVVADMWKGGQLEKSSKLHSSKFLTQQVIQEMKQGQRANEVWDRYHPNPRIVDGKRKGRPSCFIRRLELRGKSPVIAGRGEFVHPTQHRFLTVQEQARLCGYPWGYEFIGPINSQFQQIGKAVCPHVGEYVARIAAAGCRRNEDVMTLAPREVTIYRDKVEVRDI